MDKPPYRCDSCGYKTNSFTEIDDHTAILGHTMDFSDVKGEKGGMTVDEMTGIKNSIASERGYADTREIAKDSIDDTEQSIDETYP